MVEVSEADFEVIANEVMDELPREYIERLDNVVIVAEDEPTLEQRRKLKLHCNQTLFGLYEGIPLTKRNASYNFVLPDKITLFRIPIMHYVDTPSELRRQIKHTLWHEIAHYYGLDHDRIHEIERHWR